MFVFFNIFLFILEKVNNILFYKVCFLKRNEIVCIIYFVMKLIYYVINILNLFSILFYSLK